MLKANRTAAGWGWAQRSYPSSTWQGEDGGGRSVQLMEALLSDLNHMYPSDAQLALIEFVRTQPPGGNGAWFQFWTLWWPQRASSS